MAKLTVSLIAFIKDQLVVKGVNLIGDCGAFEITKRVAWAARETGVQLLSKTTGANCGGFAADFLCFRDNSGLDILGKSGGEFNPKGELIGPGNEPQMLVLPPDPNLAGRWRAPIDPGDTDDNGNIDGIPEPPEPPANPPPSDNLTTRVAQLEAQVLANANRVEAINARFDTESRLLNVHKPLPDYVGTFSIFGYRVTVTSRPK